MRSRAFSSMGIPIVPLPRREVADLEASLRGRITKATTGPPPSGPSIPSSTESSANAGPDRRVHLLSEHFPSAEHVDIRLNCQRSQIALTDRRAERSPPARAPDWSTTGRLSSLGGVSKPLRTCSIVVGLCISWAFPAASQQPCTSNPDQSAPPVFDLQHGRFGCPSNGKYVTNVRFGAAYPHGALRGRAGVGATTSVDILIVRHSPRFSWGPTFGFSTFPGLHGQPAVRVYEYSANAAFVVLRTQPWFFLRGGLGACQIDTRSVRPGTNVGSGFGYPVAHLGVLEVSYNYQSTLSEQPFIRYSNIQVGFFVKSASAKQQVAKWLTSIKNLLPGGRP